jgi:hypothetical protein
MTATTTKAPTPAVEDKKMAVDDGEADGGGKATGYRDGKRDLEEAVLDLPVPADARALVNGSTQAAAHEKDAAPSALDYDGYTSTDSISNGRLHRKEWRLLEVRTRMFATNPGVTQYWHWVTEDMKEKRDEKVIEHQVPRSVRPIRWAVFKEPYNFHLELSDIQEVLFARGSTRVIVTYKEGRSGWDINPRGDIMAQFKRERTTKRFLTFLSEKKVKITEVGV